MTEQIDKLPDEEIGKRLRIAREAAKVTQADAADAAGVVRTTIVAIEKGQRRVRMDELQKLAALYGTSANAILRREAVHIDMVPRFRKLPQSGDSAIEEAAALLNQLVRAEVELENALGVQRVRNYPPERPILPGDVRAQAEQDAQELRDWLGLGAGPVLDIVSILDLQLGIRVYLRRLDGKVSGLFAYDETAGACMLLNASHPADRVRQTGTHELGHFTGTRKQPEVLLEDEKSSSREERYANCFARCFLTPALAVRQRFAEITAGSRILTRRNAHHPSGVMLSVHVVAGSHDAQAGGTLAAGGYGTWELGLCPPTRAVKALSASTRLSMESERCWAAPPPECGSLSIVQCRRG